MKTLGFGFMHLPLLDSQNEGSIDFSTLQSLVDEYLARGFSYFDTGWMYCKEQSEPAIKKVLTDRYPRSAFSVTTKLPAYLLHSKSDRDKIFFEQCRRTGLSYFDRYMLHNINADIIQQFEKYDCFSWIQALKRSGKTQEVGFSFHGDPFLLEQILTTYPQFDFVQLQINYLDWESPTVQSRKCYEIAVRYNKPVYVMEPAKGGTLAKVPSAVERLFRTKNPLTTPASWAFRFVASLDGVKVVLSGMNSMEQIVDNTNQFLHYKPLSEDERTTVYKAARLINETVAIPCTGCAYCAATCPKKIPIHLFFSLYNEDARELADKKWSSQSNYYFNLSKTNNKPNACISCGQCELQCPQHLPVRRYLKAVTDRFE